MNGAAPRRAVFVYVILFRARNWWLILPEVFPVDNEDSSNNATRPFFTLPDPKWKWYKGWLRQ